MSYSPAAQIDAYGNARPVYQRTPYAVARQQSRPQRAPRFGWDPSSVNARGAMGTSANMTGLFARSLGRTYVPPEYNGPPPRLRLSPWKQRALDRFGGFDRRFERPQALGLQALVEQRYALLAGTTENTPVYRAIRKPTSVLGVLPAAASEQTVEPTPWSAPSRLSIAKRLERSVDRDCRQARNDAWHWFSDGQYRRAARNFETAVLLQPNDVESRIGELFSHLSIRDISTALAIQRNLAARNLNPFAASLDVSAKYADPASARELGADARLWGQGANRTVDSLALYVLVLWYTGQQDEALATATGAAREFANTDYANWPELMRAARAAGAGG